jgi:hypothetical protein
MRSAVAIPFFISILVFSLGWHSSAKGQDPFSLASLSGKYKFDFQGNLPHNATIGGTGVMVFDGNGHFKGTEKIVTPGGPLHADLSGRYTVNSDGTGTMMMIITYQRLTTVTPGGWPDSNQQIVHNTFVIDPASSDIRFSNTDPSVDVSGRMRKQE